MAMAMINFETIIMSARDGSPMCVGLILNTGLRCNPVRSARPLLRLRYRALACSRDFLKLDSALDKSA